MGHEPLDDFMRIGMQDPASAAGDHPEPEVLLAYQAEELRDADAARVREHVAACPTCRQCVDDFAAIPELESEDAARSEADLDADWRDLMGRLRRTGADVPVEPVPPHAEPLPTRRSAPADVPPDRKWLRWFLAPAGHGVPFPLAAGFLLAAVGLGTWQHRSAQAPRGNVAVRDVTPERDMRREERGPEWPQIVVPPGAERVVLLFPLVDNGLVTEPGAEPAPLAASYRLEIAPESKPTQPCLRRSGLVPDADRTVSVDLAPGALAAGPYQARVFTGEGGDSVAQYRFQLVYK